MLSYAEIVEADQYFEGRDDAVRWFTLSEQQKKSVLEHASRFLDHAFQWKGTPTDAGQPLRWPRMNVVDPDGVPLDQNTVPVQIKYAVLEQALFLTEPGNQGRNDLSREGVKSASLGKMSLTFESAVEREQLSPEAAAFVRGLGTFCSSGKNAGKSGFFLRG